MKRKIVSKQESWEPEGISQASPGEISETLPGSSIKKNPKEILREITGRIFEKILEKLGKRALRKSLSLRDSGILEKVLMDSRRSL